jgi:hypothetical protein
VLGDWQLAYVRGIRLDTQPDLRALDALLDASPGCTWRSPRGDGAPCIVDPKILMVDLSRWRSVEALVEVIKSAAYEAALPRHWGTSVLWWVPWWYEPDVDDAADRLGHLMRKGSDDYAFDLVKPEMPPSMRPVRRHATRDWDLVANDAPWLDRASTSRDTCPTCDRTIAKGDVRILEHRTSGRMASMVQTAYHLACAVESRPRIVQEVITRGVLDDALIPDPVALHRRLNERIELLDHEARGQRDARLAAVAAPVASTDPVLEALFAQLEEQPDDHGTLAVLSDALTERGDVRGELISIQLALDGNASRHDDDRFKRREELHALLAPRLQETGNTMIWGTGFIRQLALGLRTSERIGLLGALWRHPSLRLLQHLITGGQNATAALAEAGLSSLRRLELGRGSDPLGALDRLTAALPRLETLRLDGRPAAAGFAHPRLRRLELGLHATPLLPILDPEALPALEELQLHGFAELAETLTLPRWSRLKRITAVGCVVDAAAVETLRLRLDGRRLAHLDLTSCTIASRLRPALRQVCDEVVLGHEELTDNVRHRNKPEWGVGKILRRRDNKLEIEFPGVGIKVFREDAPFLEPA